MKKIFCMLTLCAALPMMGLTQAATPYKGGISVEIAGSEVRDGQITFAATVHFSGLRLSSTQMVELTPVVRFGGNETEYQPVVIVMPQREKINARDRKLGAHSRTTEPSQVIVLNRRANRWVDISVTVPYEEWMRDAELVLVETCSVSNGAEQEYSPGVFSHTYTRSNSSAAYAGVTIPKATQKAPARQSASRKKDRPTAAHYGNNAKAEAYRPKFRLSYLSEGTAQAAGQTESCSYCLSFGQGAVLINRTIGNNAVALAESDAKIRAILNTPKQTITAINIKGYASPEGECDSNRDLAAERVQTLINYMANVHNLRAPDVKVTSTSIGEDWTGLRNLVENSTLDDRYQILDALDNYSDTPRRKQALRELNGGVSYAVLMSYFPTLRRVEYTVEYSSGSGSRQDTQTEQFNSAAREIDQGAYESAIVYFSRQNRAEAWNNLGVAYWRQGNDERALEYLHRAADAGLNAAKENLREYSLWDESYTDR
ncbi:hypothetical protein LJC45_05660 [Alistipes sp. OttesenSCG-928-B03]|nr:hypothetical protein [Alistipes sp. OttesenSCG-928-B03]